MRIGVVGAGALGLTAALRLTQSGHQVEVLEREPEAGGLAAGFRIGNVWLEKFYHHLFRTDRAIVALIGELGLADRLVWRRPDTSLLYGGRIWGLDSPDDVLRFTPLSPIDRLRLGATLAYLKLLPKPLALSQVTAARWLRRWMGEPVYRAVWEPLLRGKFQEHADEVAMPWFWARVHCRTPALGYLRGGFQQLYDHLVERIEQQSGRVHLGHAVRRIAATAGGGARVETDAGPVEFERLIVSLPTRLFLDLAEGLPDGYRQQYHRTSGHLSAHCLILGLDRPFTRGVYWLNIADPGYPFLSLVEHTSFLPPTDYGGLHLLYLGNYLAPNHPLFSQSADAILADYTPYLRRLNPAFSETWVRQTWSFSAPYAQPIVQVGYPDRLPPHRTPLPGVYLANMGHIYPQDRGQNYAVLLGERIARLALDDEP